jgi:EmrB/QacA subfamily drug resistance transporter
MSATIGERPRASTGAAPRDERWVALYVLCVGMLMIVLDVTVVNVALPSIQDDLRFSTSSLAWVVNAYLIAFGGLLLLAGRLGDLVGRRNIFLAGIGLFTAASLLCGLAESQTLLIAARFAQGVGGAMTSAVILGMIVTMFPEPREQAKAIGVYAFVASAGGSVGLLAGGVITQSIDWHWIFFVNIPIGIATAVFALRLLERDAGVGIGAGAGADIPGGVLITAALMLGVYTIVKPAADYGWGAGRTLALGGLAVALLACFFVREATARNPLVPLRIFRSRNVVAANAIQILSVAGMFGMFFLGALYLRRVLGYDALQIGLSFLPVTLTMGTLSIRYSERLVTRFGARATVVPGLALIALALVLFAQVPVQGSYFLHVMPSMLLLGIGAGICFPALMNLAMSGIEPRDAGLASGLVNTTAQIGGALGLAVLATLSASHTRRLLAQGHSSAAALTGGYHLAFWIAALPAAALAIGPAVLSSAPSPAASRDAQPVREADAPNAREHEHGREHAGARGGATSTEPTS